MGEVVSEGLALISYNDFARLDLRVARIVSAEKVDGSDKLLKLGISFGVESRTLVAGIAKYYSPSELVDKAIIVIYNLEPKKLRGIESQGMLLAAEDGEGRVSLLTIDKFVGAGAKIH